MTPEQMQIVIAEELGWKSITTESMFGFPLLVGLHPTLNLQQAIPNYPTDLNACHEMEKVLDFMNDEYYNQLWIVVKGAYNSRTLNEKNRRVFCATALQRCEAWIKTRCPERWVD